MTQTQYDQLSDYLLTHARQIADAKRPGYTQLSADVLHNFKSTAQRYGITPLQVWGVFIEKHLSALATFAKDPDAPQAEAITGRYADAVNYLQLGFALGIEVGVIADPSGVEEPF